MSDTLRQTSRKHNVIIYSEVINMLDIIIEYHKRVLSKMIEENVDYNEILKESQLLDEYIVRKMKELV